MGTILDALAEKRLALFPVSTRVVEQAGASELTVAGLSVASLAERYGTPLYLYDRLTLDQAVEEYRCALAKAYPAGSGITYAGKAFLCIAIAQWAAQSDLVVDCTGAGELAIAAAAQVNRGNILVHGVNKSAEDLHSAIKLAGIIVVDNLSELERLRALAQAGEEVFPEIWLRLRPGMAVSDHQYTQTGQENSKFGLSVAEFHHAVKLCLESRLPLKGLHFHQGSHFHNPAPVAPAVDTALNLLARERRESGWFPEVLCPGGGWGVPYHEEDLPHLNIQDYVQFVSTSLVQGCRERGIPLPRLQLEPGRSLVARAGIAVYRVGAVKHTRDIRWLLIDGGLADNPRPALYGARYSALPVTEPGRPAVGRAWIAGPYCESGDILIKDLPLPALEPGELLAVPVSGAYHISMGSNYNGARKPAVVWLHQGQAQLIQRRETTADLLSRDLPL